MKCPTCTDTALVMSDRQGVEIDYCPQCRSVWLDRGETRQAENGWTAGSALASGLASHELHALLDTFCEDLLSSNQLQWADVCPVDERALAGPDGEIQDPALRLKLLRLCFELAEVDTQVDEGESIVLVAAAEHWGLRHEVFRSWSRH